MRLIDADALHIDFDRYVEHIKLMKKGRIPKTEIAILLDCKGAIDNAPTIDAVPVRKHGKWIRTGRTNVYGGCELECSACGDRLTVRNIECELYCRNCGARMDEE